MSKRKSPADLRHGFNPTGRRPSVPTLQSRAMNPIHWKPGATNVHSTSSYKGVMSHPDTQRNILTVSATSKSSISRNETTKMPKTRFDRPSGWNTSMPRLKRFPVETVRRTVASSSYSPLSLNKIADQDTCERVESSSTPANANAWAKNLPGCEYEDTLKLCPASALVQQQRQGEEIRKSPEAGVGISQQDMPIAPNVSRITQSGATLNGRVLSPEQTHRPFVPITAHGMALRNLTPHMAAISPWSAVQRSYAPCAEKCQQPQHEQVSPATVEQTQRPQVPICQQVQKNSRESTIDQPRSKVPWKVDGSATVCDYELQPIGGRNFAARDLAPGPNERPENQRQLIDTVRAATMDQESSDRHDSEHREIEQQQQPYQQELSQYQEQQEQAKQGPSRPVLNSMQFSQNSQQMYQQLQNNKIHQQEMQRKALAQQQQMTAMTQQQMRGWPLAHQLKTSEQRVKNNQEPCSNHCNQRQIYNGQLSNSTPDIYTKKIDVPHHQMLMQQQNARNKSSYTNPRHDCRMPNRNAIAHLPSLKGQLQPFAVDFVSPNEKNMTLDDMKQNEQLKQIETLPMPNQMLPQQQGGTHWQHRVPCPRYEAAMHQYPSAGHVQQEPDPLSSQQYVSTQSRRQDSVLLSEASVVHHIQQQQQGKQQHKQEQQQLGMIKQLAPRGSYRLPHTAKTKYPGFTAEMIRDQELLVSNMRQQKIPDNLMSRQFEALLSEQRRHLTFFGGGELTENIRNTTPRSNSGALHGDQRPDWMERITPTLREHVKQYDQGQPQIFQRIPTDPQYMTIPPDPLHILNRQNGCQLGKQQTSNQQYSTALQASTPYTSVALSQMSSPLRGTSGWLQQNDGPNSSTQCVTSQYNDFQARSDQQPYWQQSVQRQYQQQPEQNQSQQMYHTQQQQCVDCPPGVYTSPEQYPKRDRMMLRKITEECSATLPREQHEPWSLLKLRDFRKYIRPQRQNNGLQDAETVKTAQQAMEAPEVKEGLEYVAELGKKMTTLKLNGTQDPGELENISLAPVEYLKRMQERQHLKVSSNGLCNTRNANNPASPPISFPKKIDPSPIAGYPRQHYPGEKRSQTNMTQGVYRMIAEKENGSVAGTFKRDDPAAMFVDYDQPRKHTHSYCPMQATAPDQYLSWQLAPIDGRSRRSTIPCGEGKPICPQGTIPIMPYKFDRSEPLYHQQMEQYYRNRLNLRNAVQSNTVALAQGSGKSRETTVVPQFFQNADGDHVQLETSGAHPNTRLDRIHQQESCPIEEMATTQTYRPDNVTQMAENKEANAQCLTMQHTTTASNHGQPEIREPKTIGGLTYLARKVDYIQNPPVTAPNSLLASKFLQPAVSFN